MPLPQDVVLVHGAWHGAWCWSSLTRLLKERGHRVVCPEWPGRAPGPACHLTLADALGELRHAIARCPQPPLVVAHSMAGMLLAVLLSEPAVAVGHAVFLAAHVPVSGESAASLTRDLGLTALERCLLPDAQTCRVSLRRASARRLFYDDVPTSLAEDALDRLIPEPLPPMQERVVVCPEALRRSGACYLACEEDQVLPLTVQQQLAARASLPLRSIPGSHSPFLARPEALLTAIDSGLTPRE